MDELSSVNDMLESIGEAPVDTLDGNTQIEVAIARRTLRTVSREVQTQGFHQNTQTLELSPDENGLIQVPEHVLRIDPSNGAIDAVVRQGKLFHKARNSFVWDGPLIVDLVWFLEFEDLQPHISHYITCKALRQFHAKIGRDIAWDRLARADEEAARIRLEQQETMLLDANILRDNDSMRALRRRAF